MGQHCPAPKPFGLGGTFASRRRAWHSTARIAITPHLMQSTSPITPTLTAFWQYHGDFWVGTILSVISLGLTVWAALAATGAKRAANKAARTVNLQAVAIELMDIAKVLASFDDPDITFPAARDFLQGINFKLRRLITPFREYHDLGPFVNSIRDTLDNALKALKGVRPAPGAAPAPERTVYNAIEADVSTLNTLVAELLGLMQKRSMNITDPDTELQ